MEEEWQGSISSMASSASSGKSEQIRLLNNRLLTESLSRQETGDLYKRLQEEYDILLAKHAQAENTIDQLRIGARVNLFSDGPIPNQAVESRIIEVKSPPQPILFSKGDRAFISGPNDVRPLKDASAGNSPENNDRVDGEDDRNLSKFPNKPENEQVHVALRLKDLQNDIGAFQSAIAERELSYEQQRNLYNALKDKHDKLKTEIGKLNQEKSSKTQGNDPIDRQQAKFMDPNSLEGELYRLELRLGEVCDDIGEQLFSENQKTKGNDELEKALRNDFQRLRIASKSSDQHIPKERTEGRQNFFVSSGDHSRVSRSESIFSERSKNANSFSENAGSSSPHEKQPNYSEDLAESGYYASESVIRESPRRGSNVPHRYLTRSQSPDVKHPGYSTAKRHWSLSEVDQPIESVDEFIIYSSEGSDRHGNIPDVPSDRDLNARLKELQDDRKSSRLSRDDSRAQRSVNSSRRSSTQSNKRPNISPEQCQVGPAATSSPLDEQDTFLSRVTPPAKGNASVKSSAAPSSVHRQSVNSRPASINRTSPSWNKHRDSFSDSRKQNRPGSRISKTRSRQLQESSSEDSCANTRPDRINSSVYSEQDKVPSLVNQPKGNIYGVRHRPNTADSNVDSGFVGSEGTLRSQEFQNGGKQIFLNGDKRPEAKQMQERYGGSEGEEMLHPSLQFEALSAARKESVPHSTDRKHPRNLRRSRAPRKDQKTNSEPENWDSYSVPDTGSSVLPTRGHHLSDDITSIDSRRIALPAHRPSDPRQKYVESSANRQPKTPSENYHHTESYRDNLRERLKPRRDSYGKRSSFASVEPKLSVIYQEDDSYAPLPISRGRTIHDTSSSINAEKDERESSRSAAWSRGQQTQPTRIDNGDHERLRPRPALGREGNFTEPLREELQLLRDELARLSRAQAFAKPTRQEQSRTEPIQGIQNSALYDELKRKLHDLSEQIDRNTQTDNERYRSLASSTDREDPDELNRNFQELKAKLDALAHDVRKNNNTRPTFDTTSPLQQSSPVVTPVCPICSGMGYHRHGDYLFPRDFLESGGPVTIIPSRESPVPIINRTPRIVTSTPYEQKKATHFIDHPSTPVSYTAIPTSYRILPDAPAKVTTPVYPISNTIHHIHTFSGNHRSESSSSSDYSSDEDDSRRRSRRRKSRNRNRNSHKALDQTNDWRINDSLNEASRAANNMQRISRRMLSTLATDLINSGYSEF